MNRYLPLLALPILLWTLVGCDGDDTPEVWDWTSEDSIQVVAALDAQEDFLSSRDHLASGTIQVLLRADTLDAIRADTLNRRFLVKSFSISIIDTFYGYRFELGLDTTVTAYVLDSLEGSVELSADSVLEPSSDSAVPLDTLLTKFYRYSSRGDCFLDTLGEDTVWRIARYSGGIRGAAPEVASAPTFDSLILSHPQGTLTVDRSAEPDGYGIRRLMEPEEFIHLSSGESVSVDQIFAPGTDTLVLYVAGPDGTWQPYQPGSAVTFTTEGWFRFYVIGIRLKGLVYPSAEYASVVWGIPVIVE